MQNRPRHLTTTALLAAVSLVAAGQSAAGDPAGLAALKSAEAALVDLIKQAEPSVVAVTRRPAGANNRAGVLLLTPAPDDPFGDLRRLAASPQAATPVGAGVVIDASGLILTQYLVVNQGDRHFVTTVDGQTHEAEIRGADPRSGLAVLAVKQPPSDDGAQRGAFRPLPLGLAEKLSKGSGVVAIGNPNAVASDGQPTASYGTVTNLAQKAGAQVNLNGARDDANTSFRTTIHHHGTLIQTDARLGWNASGGAVVNLDGELVGVTTTASVIAGHEQPAGYAIPLNEAMRRVVDTLKEGREAEYGFLGIEFSFTAAPGDDTPSAVLVKQAFPGGPAGRAGLVSGDMITRIKGEPIPDSDGLLLLIGQEPPGARLPVEFLRNGSQKETIVELGKYFTRGEQVITTPAPRWRGIRVDYPTAIPPEQLRSAAQQGRMDPQGCVVVADVDPNSVSWRQGVRQGMFITHVSGVRVSTPPEFWAAVEEADASVKLRFTSGLAEPNDADERTAPRNQPR